MAVGDDVTDPLFDTARVRTAGGAPFTCTVGLVGQSKQENGKSTTPASGHRERRYLSQRNTKGGYVTSKQPRYRLQHVVGECNLSVSQGHSLTAAEHVTLDKGQ